MNIKRDFKTGNRTNSLVSHNISTNHTFDFHNSNLFTFIHNKDNCKIIEASSILYLLRYHPYSRYTMDSSNKDITFNWNPLVLHCLLFFLFPGLWGASVGECLQGWRYFWILPDTCGLQPCVRTHFKKALCRICLVVLFTNPSARARYDTRSIFKRSLTGLNSVFLLLD